MLTHYLRSAWRNIRRQPGFAFVNVFGLAIGLASCLLITHLVFFHNGFDKQSDAFQRTYRIQYSRWMENGDKVSFASASPTIGPAVSDMFPEVESFARMFQTEGVFFHKDVFFEEQQVFWGESALFDILGMDIIYGNASGCLDRPGQIVLSRSAALKYFNREDPIGEVLRRNNKDVFEVTAVFEDMPANMHFQADMFISMATWMQEMPELFSGGWYNSGFYTYVRLREGTEPEYINAGIAAYMDREFGEVLSGYQMGMSFVLQPLTDIHLDSHFMHELSLNSNRTTIRLLSAVAWFILLIAWVNYINLSSIRSSQRIRETGIRKVAGASRRQLSMQALFESGLMNLMAVLLALVIFEVSLPVFERMAGIPHPFPVWQKGWFWLVLLIAFTGGTFPGGLLALSGLSGNNLTTVLKGGLVVLGDKGTLRKILVSFQFLIAIVLIMATFVVMQQLRYMNKQPLGFRLEHMLVVKAPSVGDPGLHRRFNAFCQEAAAIAGFDQAGFSSIIPGKPNIFNRGGIYVYGSDASQAKNFRVTETAHSFFDTYEIRFLAGEGFTGMEEIDQQRVVINRHGALWLGFESAEEACGKQLVLEGNVFLISGVVSDFFQLSPRESVEPQLFRYPQRHQGYFSFRMEETAGQAQLEQLNQLFVSFFPDNPFVSFYLDEFYYAQYAHDERTFMVFASFSLLVVLLTVIGLMGLAAYTAEQRKKEIGIRKVLGASDTSVLALLSKTYLVLWAVASVLALPLGGILLQRWLNNFAFHIDLSALHFLWPPVLVLIIALLTVWVQSQRALRMNPVNSLRNE